MGLKKQDVKREEIPREVREEIRREADGIYQFYLQNCGVETATKAFCFAMDAGRHLYHHRRSLNFAMGVRLALSNRPYRRSLDTAA